MTTRTDHLFWLQKWYRAHTDGDWEHQHGIRIGTIDNPGWRVDIDLAETEAATKPFSRIEIERNDFDWVHCWIEEEQFKIACGPENLNEGLGFFRNWITQLQQPLQ